MGRKAVDPLAEKAAADAKAAANAADRLSARRKALADNSLLASNPSQAAKAVFGA